MIGEVEVLSMAGRAERKAVSVPAKPGGSRPGPRRTRGRRLASGPAILDAATSLFLARGYQATSMDDIAALAQVSKQTIYTHFTNKEELFAELVLGNVERVDAFVASIPGIVAAAPDLPAGLRDLALRYLEYVIRPEVLRLRRLIIGETGRFPDLARTYFEAVPERTAGKLAELFTDLDRDGRLRVGDPLLAAHHFAWLVLGWPLDRGMFAGDDEDAGPDPDVLASEAVRVFLAAYGPR
jgi:TetR/AcrR family transcriptional repressor of mexJK operon